MNIDLFIGYIDLLDEEIIEWKVSDLSIGIYDF
jgi:hypothetical protein